MRVKVKVKLEVKVEVEVEVKVRMKVMVEVKVKVNEKLRVGVKGGQGALLLVPWQPNPFPGVVHTIQPLHLLKPCRQLGVISDHRAVIR
jgi:hypothetical protein